MGSHPHMPVERPFTIWMPVFIQIAGGEQWLDHQHHNKNRKLCCPYEIYTNLL